MVVVVVGSDLVVVVVRTAVVLGAAVVGVVVVAIFDVVVIVVKVALLLLLSVSTPAGLTSGLISVTAMVVSRPELLVGRMVVEVNVFVGLGCTSFSLQQLRT